MTNMDDLDNLDSLDALDSLDSLDALDSLDGPAKPTAPVARAGMTEDGVEPGPLEGEAAEELSEVLAGFKQRARDEQERFDNATLADYWVTFVFQTFDQAEAFRAAVGEPSRKYADGYAVAKRMGIELPHADVSYNDGSRPDLKLMALLKPRDGMDDMAEDMAGDLGEEDDLSGLEG